ncbi:hypothetical protein R6Q57_001935 [Mikania cordata]
MATNPRFGSPMHMVLQTCVVWIMQFLVGSIHILKLPLFQRACEVTFNESDENKDHYISLSEIQALFE